MGYFANSTESDDYASRWCNRCVHGTMDERMCPIIEAHITYNYDQCNEDKRGKDLAAALSIFIPRQPDGGNGRCQMFIEAKP